MLANPLSHPRQGWLRSQPDKHKRTSRGKNQGTKKETTKNKVTRLRNTTLTMLHTVFSGLQWEKNRVKTRVCLCDLNFRKTKTSEPRGGIKYTSRINNKQGMFLTSQSFNPKVLGVLYSQRSIFPMSYGPAALYSQCLRFQCLIFQRSYISNVHLYIPNAQYSQYLVFPVSSIYKVLFPGFYLPIAENPNIPQFQDAGSQGPIFPVADISCVFYFQGVIFPRCYLPSL